MKDYLALFRDCCNNGNAKPTKPPFGYYGAKQRLARRIIESLPPHNAWVEAFCGSAALTLAKPVVPIEIINDLDGEVVNLFGQLRDNAAELCRVIALTPYARSEFEAAKARSANLSPLERARRFLVSSMMTVNGIVGSTHAGFSFSQSYARGGKEARVCRWYNLPARLEQAAERLRQVRIENRDARELLAMFEDRPATLVYLDPPYHAKRAHKYSVGVSDQGFHEDLLRICSRAKCMILISGYESPLYNRFLCPAEGWHKTTIKTHTRDTQGNDYSRTEVLWSNRHFREAKSSGVVPIRLSRKEKANNKVNPPRRR